MKMNNYILLVMKWLNDKNSVTQEELRENRNAADTHATYSTATYSTATATYSTYATAAATHAAATYATDAEKWVNKYFERTGEDKQVYIDALKPKEDKPIDTRTDKEKAIDEIREEYLAYTGEVMGAFEFAYDKWVGE